MGEKKKKNFLKPAKTKRPDGASYVAITNTPKLSVS